MTVGVLYLGRFKEGEESQSSDWPSVRVGALGELRAEVLQPADRWVLRAKRLSLSEYCAVWDAVQTVGGELVGSPLSYAVVSSLRAVQDALAPFSPPMVAGRGDQSPEDFAVMATDAGLKPPLFLRSEVESAAKHVGFDGCVVSTLSSADVETPLEALRQHVSGFSEIAMKEIWQIKKLGATDFDLEYRTVGFRGKLVAIDLPRGNLLPLLEPWHLDFLNRAYAAMARLGADGLHVLDMAIRDSNRKPYVVEWKDFSSSSFKNPGASLRAAIDAVTAV